MEWSQGATPKVLWGFLLVACLGHVHSYPSLYVARYTGDRCTAHPYTHFGKVHDYTSRPDKTVSFTLQSKATGKTVKPANGVSKICLGDVYNLKVSFGAPSLRNYLLTATHGSFVVKANDCDAWCPNRVCSPAPASQADAQYSLPCSVAGGTKVTLKITSANGRIPTPGSTLRSAAIALQADAGCGKCRVTTEKAAVNKRQQPAQAGL